MFITLCTTQCWRVNRRRAAAGASSFSTYQSGNLLSCQVLLYVLLLVEEDVKLVTICNNICNMDMELILSGVLALRLRECATREEEFQSRLYTRTASTPLLPLTK